MADCITVTGAAGSRGLYQCELVCTGDTAEQHSGGHILPRAHTRQCPRFGAKWRE